MSTGHGWRDNVSVNTGGFAARLRRARGCVTFTIALGCALASACGHATSTPAADTGLQTILAERVDELKWATGIVVGIVDEHGRRFVAYGGPAAGDPRRVNERTVFEVGSLTKIFTSVLLADMARRNEVAITDPVAKYLPADRVTTPTRNGAQITLVDLATHTSGLPLRPTNLKSNTALNKYADYTVEQMYAGLSSYTLTRDIGSQFEYSNWGYGLLGHALSLRAKQPYEELLRARVLTPLGMSDTRFTPTAPMRTRIATGHNDELLVVPDEGTGALEGAGGLYSTGDDLLKFIEACLGYRSSPLAPAMQSMLQVRRPTQMPGLEIALGWRVESRGDLTMIWSNGRTDGFRAFMGFDPAKRIGVVALANAGTDAGVDDIGQHVLDSRITPIRAHKEVAIDPALFDRYVGHYKFDDGNVMTITRLGTRLISQMTDQNPLDIYPEGDRKFFVKLVEAQITFEDAGDRPAPALVLHQDGESWRAVRVR
jgi:serine-type D-Ala-D-Ala carboxypeptidase/endopeptidase